ncbi:hypothetical protein BD289DRAFT_115631 [Coniella lustricola]|uniref:Rhodopsin domain-containing protein n=1 Tax=Coniella lustricola TaxID=2025994 RepID=A0A2T2ZX17_9PEZI|nr:hypothetical protein BD289DRAFT_115631 [Coniella lustricola]
MWDYGEDNRGSTMAAVSIAMASLSAVAVALRSYTMATILKRFLFEDWLAVVTCIFQIFFCVIVVVGVSFGLGAHVENVPEVNRPKALVTKWAGQVIYVVVSTLVKFVVGIFLLRLCVNNNWQRITILLLLIIVGIFNVFYFFMAVFQCQPANYYWWRYTANPPVTGQCNGHELATIPTYFAFLIGIISDLTLALLPATLIKGANLDKKTKISVCCVLALGSLASLATLVRIPYAKQLLSNPDYLYNFTDLAIWSIVECGIAITASSLATLRPLFIKWKVLAASHMTKRYASNGLDPGMPIQSAKTVTIISASRDFNSKRNTILSGTTALTGATGRSRLSGGLSGVREGREVILVEKDIEMSVITRGESEDSLEQLEREVDEVIWPGAARRKASQDRMSLGPSLRKKSADPSRPPRPAQLQTNFSSGSNRHLSFSNPGSGEPSSASPGQYLPRGTYSSPSSPQPRRQPSDGQVGSDTSQRNARMGQSPPTSPYSDEGSPYERIPDHAYSGTSTRIQRPTNGPPNFHLPTRLQRQDTVPNRTVAAPGHYQGRNEASKGLSPPPWMMQANGSHQKYVLDDAQGALGSAIDMIQSPTRSLSNTPVLGSQDAPIPSPGLRFPFQSPNSLADGTRRAKGPKSNHWRPSDISIDPDLSPRARLTDPGHEVVDVSLRQSPRSPREAPSPLGSHPPLSPRQDWV